MKIKSVVTINMGLYMDIRPEVEIDTENYTEAKKLIRELHKNFYGLLNGRTEEDIINADLAGASQDDTTQNALKNTDWNMQDLFNKVGRGEAIPVVVWQELTPTDQGILHKAMLQHNQKQRLAKKDADTK